LKASSRKPLVLSGLLTLSLAAAACGGGTEATGGGGTDATGGSGSEEAFYEGKTIELIVPASPGGGSDTTARLIGPFLTEFLPGNPDVVIENIPGGGTILGSNEYALERKADGTKLLLASASALGAFAIGQEEVQYDPSKFTFIAGFPSGMVFYTSPETGISEPADMLNPDEPLVLGSTSATGIGTLSLLAIEVLDIADQVQIVSGYGGAGDARVAFEQGEINLLNQTGQAYSSKVTPLVDAGTAVPLFSLGVPGKDGDVLEDPAFPDLPTIVEFHEEMYGEPPSGAAWDALQALMGIVPYLPIVIQDDAPQEAIDALIEAARELRDNEEFQEKKVEIAGDYPLWVGEDWDPIKKTVTTLDPKVKAWVQDWLEEKHGVTGLA
jgi:tripartite-type tricarboxylate transporter receptor subunit TctC